MLSRPIGPTLVRKSKLLNVLASPLWLAVHAVSAKRVATSWRTLFQNSFGNIAAKISLKAAESGGLNRPAGVSMCI